MAEDAGGMSKELDELSSTLIGDALDMLADGQDLGVLLVVEDADRHVAPYEFSDDETNVCLDAAREKVRELGRSGDSSAGISKAQRYALAYEGAVEDDQGSFDDALLVEFGERGAHAYSAFSYYEGKGQGEEFRWSEPAPAGEMDSLL